MAHFDPRFSIHVPLVPPHRKRSNPEHNPITTKAVQTLQNVPSEPQTHTKRKADQLETENLTALVVKKYLPDYFDKSTPFLELLYEICKGYAVAPNSSQDPIQLIEFIGLHQEDIPNNLSQNNQHYELKIQSVLLTIARCVVGGQLNSLSDSDAKGIVKLLVLIREFDCKYLLNILSLLSKQQLIQETDLFSQILFLLGDEQVLQELDQGNKSIIVSFCICAMEYYLKKYNVETRITKSACSDFFDYYYTQKLLDIMRTVVHRILLSDEDKKVVTKFLFTLARALGVRYETMRQEELNKSFMLIQGIHHSNNCIHVIKSIHDISITLGLKEAPEGDPQALEFLLYSNCCSTGVITDLNYTNELMFMFNFQPSSTTHDCISTALDLILEYNMQNFEYPEVMVEYLSSLSNKLYNAFLRPSELKRRLLEKLHRQLNEINQKIISCVVTADFSKLQMKKLCCLGVISYLTQYDPSIENEIIGCIDKLQSTEIIKKNKTLGIFMCSIGLFLKDSRPLSLEFYTKLNHYLSEINFAYALNYSYLNRERFLRALIMFINHMPISRLILARKVIDKICTVCVKKFNTDMLVQTYQTKSKLLLVLSMFIENGITLITPIDVNLINNLFSTSFISTDSMSTFCRVVNTLYRYVNERPSPEILDKLTKYLNFVEPYLENLNIQETAQIVAALDYLYFNPPSIMSKLQSRLNRQLDRRNLGR